jgi:Tfp pilus assembly protein PilF
MEGRRVRTLGVCLLIAAAGCQHQVWSVPGSGPNSSGSNAPPPPTPAQVQKAPTKPKDLPPLVLVSSGDWKSAEAFAPNIEPDRQQPICELARVDYEKALKIDPKCVPAYQGLARLYKGMHDLPLAIETYQKALKLDPKNATLWYELGLCHNSQKNWGLALECLSRASQIDPGNRSYVNTQGVVLAAAGRYDESLNFFVRSNGEAMGYYRLAQTLQHLQQPELSRRYLEAAVHRDPSLAPATVQRNTSDVAVNPAPAAVQQTAYHAPTIPPTQAVPEQVPQVITQKISIPEQTPQVISQNVSTPAQGPVQQPPIILPPPPAIHVDYEQLTP